MKRTREEKKAMPAKIAGGLRRGKGVFIEKCKEEEFFP